MATYDVKLARRGALLELNNRVCKVKLKGWGRTFTTGGKIITLTGIDSVQMVAIRELQDELYNVTQITHIEMPASRFTPNKLVFMEVAW